MQTFEKKYDTTWEDFKQRCNKAINDIVGRTFIDSKGKLYTFTKKDIEERFMFQDTLKDDEMHDDFFMNGEYIICPKEEVILV